jgi:hypothetical protein
MSEKIRNQRPHKSITIYEDYVEFQNQNFRIKTEVTEDRDINGCIARAIEHGKNANLTGLTINDTRIATD